MVIAKRAGRGIGLAGAGACLLLSGGVLCLSMLGGCDSSFFTTSSGNRSGAAGGYGQDVLTQKRTAEKTAATEAVAKGRELTMLGSYDDALREFEKAIAINPRMTVAYLGAGDIYVEKGEYQQAEAHFAEAARVEPQNFDAQYKHGLSLQFLNRLTEAVRAYLRALTLRPNDPEANLNLATAYLQLGEPAQGRPFAEKAVRLAPESGPARANLGSTYAGMGQHEAAVVEYQQAAELMELSPELLLNMADSLGQIGRHAEMAATLDQLIRIEPSAIAYERLGSALFRLKRYDEALAAFRRGTELDEGHYPAWNGVGVCLLNRYVWSERTDTASRKGAVDALRRSLRIDPNQPRIVELVRRYD